MAQEASSKALVGHYLTRAGIIFKPRHDGAPLSPKTTPQEGGHHKPAGDEDEEGQVECNPDLPGYLPLFMIPSQGGWELAAAQ